MFTSYMAIMGVAMLVTGVVSSRIGAEAHAAVGPGADHRVRRPGRLVEQRRRRGRLPRRLGPGQRPLRGHRAGHDRDVGDAAGTAQAIILFEAALGIGIASGPLVGGLLGEHSWRAPFFGVSCLMLIALVATAFFLPTTPPTGRRTSLADPFRALRTSRCC